MKNTYDHTWTLSNVKLQKKAIRLVLLDGNKYDYDTKAIREVIYTGIIAWDIIEGGEEAKQIESMTDESGIDPNHEYLVLHFNDGSSSTYRNSFCDMFIEF